MKFRRRLNSLIHYSRYYKGRQEGKIEGEIEAYRKTAKSLFENGASFELVIASIPDLPKDEIQKIFDEIFKK